MDIFAVITKPTLLLDEQRCRANIARMAQKAQRWNVRFRPHFKTHQSAVIGEWFRPFSVTGITVSSLDMAEYFAAHGWQDITIAFPVNLRQAAGINTLAKSIHLELLAESVETITYLAENLAAPVDLWLKADVGAQRTGIPVGNHAAFIALAQAACKSPRLNFRGILTHAGHTYHASSVQAVREIYSRSVKEMQSARNALVEASFPQTQISWGDTPTCSLIDDLSSVDEIRPGNFVLYDAMQLSIGSCRQEDIAAAVACPIVALHPDRNQAVIYGGAIHLSKDHFTEGQTARYGLIALPQENGWSAPVPGSFVSSLSQEHGIVRIPAAELAKLHVGDLLVILPAHSCLAVNLYHEYLTLTGESIPIMGQIKSMAIFKIGD